MFHACEGRITIAPSYHIDITFHCQLCTTCRNQSPFAVNDTDIGNSDVMIGMLLYSYIFCRTRRLQTFACYLASTYISNSFQFAWLIDGCPGQMSIFGHCLTFHVLPVDEQFYLFTIAVSPDIYVLPFVSFQIPVR